MNRVEITGRLVRDPEVRYVGKSDFPIVSLNVAVDDDNSRFDRETNTRTVGSGFYKVEVVGEYGVEIMSALRRGDEIHVLGSLTQWRKQGKDGEEGETKTSIRAAVVTLLHGRAAVQQVIQPPAVPPIDDSWSDDPPF